MPWPLSQDYNEALQNPQSSFSDPELRQGHVVVNALGIPQPCSGNFADVYAVECSATCSKWAIKCFTREISGLRERYSEISSYLPQARLPFTVDFQYQEQGIRIAGRWYPILKMQWVEGVALNLFVRNMLRKPAKLEKLSRIWVRMARRLREAGIAHCDLQHGNILLVPDSEASALAVKLIDYDGMWVPALANVPSGEFGHSAYQHPQRMRDSIYNAAVDRFPLLVVYVALRALVVGGRQLWKRYDNGDNLLFRQSDFESPDKSPLFDELLRMNQPEIRDLAEKLANAANKPLEQTPHLADLVADERLASSVNRSRKSAAPTRPPAAEARQSAPSQDIAPEQSTRETGGSLLPWIATGVVAAFAVIGGMVLFGPQARNRSERSPSQMRMVRATESSTTEKQITEKQDTVLPPPGNEKDAPSPSDTGKKDDPTPPNSTKASEPPPSPPKSKPNIPLEEPVAIPAGKLPVPDEAILKSTTEEIQDVYKADYSSKDPAMLAVLAEKLLQRGFKKFETPERRFVFLREASEVAAKSGDMVLCFRALDELDKSFTVELLPMKAAALQLASKAARTLSANKAVLDTSLALVVPALQADDYDAAEHLLKAATEAAYKAGIPSTEIQIQAREVSRFKKNYLSIKPALATLADQPSDPQANRLVGTFLCFQKGEWQKGLPLLARGDDAKLRELATNDLAAPKSADAQAALGNSWWQLGMREKEQAKANLLERACYWYERALPDVVASVHARLMKNIEAHYKVLPALRNWDHLDVSQATMMLDYLHLPKGEKEILTRETYSGPIEITVLARTEKNNIRLRGSKGSSVIFNWERKAEELRITRPDSQQPESGSLATASVTPLVPNTWYALRWVITEEGMAVAVNGQVVFSENRKNDLSGKYPIRIHSVDSDLDVKVFRVRSLGKKVG